MNVTHQAINERAAVTGSSLPTGGEQQVRELAIKQIEGKRGFRHARRFVRGPEILPVVAWAISEYNNAGGWPTNGFSQSSSIWHVWNIWIIYPVLGWGLIVAVHAWFTSRDGRSQRARSSVRWNASDDQSLRAAIGPYGRARRLRISTRTPIPALGIAP